VQHKARSAEYRIIELRQLRLTNYHINSEPQPCELLCISTAVMQALQSSSCMQELTCADRDSGLTLRAFSKSVSLVSHSTARVGGPVTAVELACVSSL
jgi:hypothetical protein